MIKEKSEPSKRLTAIEKHQWLQYRVKFRWTILNFNPVYIFLKKFFLESGSSRWRRVGPKCRHLLEPKLSCQKFKRSNALPTKIKKANSWVRVRFSLAADFVPKDVWTSRSKVHIWVLFFLSREIFLRILLHSSRFFFHFEIKIGFEVFFLTRN